MIISVINHTNGKLSDERVQEAIRAINRQIREDFEPYWSFGATLRLEGKVGKKPNKQRAEDMRGDAVLYLWDGSDENDALGYHDKNNRGIPYGFVFTEIAAKLEESWTATLSHEALELVGDPGANLLVMGPHPNDARRTVFHWFEMCDAVQADVYEIDGIQVSNFVLPLYFSESEEKGSRNDFLGRQHNGKTLPSFGVNPGGYVGFFDPKKGKDDNVTADERARERLRIKGTVKRARRAFKKEIDGARSALVRKLGAATVGRGSGK